MQFPTYFTLLVALGGRVKMESIWRETGNSDDKNCRSMGIPNSLISYPYINSS